MSEFRPCPSYSGYSATIDGTIRRDAYTVVSNKTGRTLHRPAKLRDRYGTDERVSIGSTTVKAELLRIDAWPGTIRPQPSTRPKPSSPDGRVITLAEWREELGAKRGLRAQLIG